MEVGEPLTLIVNAKNGDDIDPSYRGTVEFESSSESADVPANYEFGEEDNGSHTFTDSVVFYEPGTHTVTVNDLLASNLEDTITINVLAPEVPTSTPVGGVTPEFCEQNPNALECNVVVITNVTKKIIDNTTVEVCFDTNIPTVAVINYGLSEGATYTDSVIVSSEYATHHCVTLKNLEDNSGYIMEIVATAQNGKQGKHSDAFATDENIEVIPIADAKQCIAIDPNGYTFNSKGQAILNFKTAEPAFCKVVYGNSKDDLPHTFELKEKVENHKAVLELSKLDGVSDLFYKIDCVNLERTCISSGVIPASRYKSYYPQKPLEITISETALPVALLIVTGATFLVNIMSYPGFMMYAIPWLTSRRRKSTWGIVYDEKTNEPVPFVMIRLYNSMGQIVKQVVTGFDGKYGFTVNKGVYTIKVSHSDYQEYKFDVEIHEKEGIAAENVGLIRKSTGQSKSIKDKIKRFMSKIKKHLFNINRVIVIAGFLLSIIALVITRSPLNVLVTLVYLVQFAILILLGRGKRDWGYVYDSKSSKRIKGASVRVFNIRESRQVDVQLTDEEGRFGFNLEDGEYYLQVNANGYSMDEGSIGKYDKLQSATGYTLIKVVVKKGKKINVALPLKADKAFTSKFAMGE